MSPSSLAMPTGADKVIKHKVKEGGSEAKAKEEAKAKRKAEAKAEWWARVRRGWKRIGGSDADADNWSPAYQRYSVALACYRDYDWS